MRGAAGPAGTHETLDRQPVIRLSAARTFGFAFGTFFLAVALFPLFRRGEPRQWALLASALFILSALVRPAVLHPLNLLAARFSLGLTACSPPWWRGPSFSWS